MGRNFDLTGRVFCQRFLHMLSTLTRSTAHALFARAALRSGSVPCSDRPSWLFFLGCSWWCPCKQIGVSKILREEWGSVNPRYIHSI